MAAFAIIGTPSGALPEDRVEPLVHHAAVHDWDTGWGLIRLAHEEQLQAKRRAYLETLPTPTPTPTRVPPTPTPSPEVSYDLVGDWSWLVCSPEWTWDCGWALAVIECESTNNPNAYNPAGYHGLWQTSAEIYDPYLNTLEAHRQYLEWRGPNAYRVESPWPNCP